jgi:adenine-specific DNA-methyltransferase
VIKYIGSKRLLAAEIAEAAARLGATSICDLFAGTTRVGQACRRRGLTVLSNDVATYSEVLGIAYIEATAEDRVRLAELLDHLRGVRPEHGYFTETFCVRSRFFQPHNGMRIDAIRSEIDRLDTSRVERALLLTSLLEAADRVDSTCGLQMAYVKRWARRSYNQLELREPDVVEGPPGRSLRRDANELAAELGGVDCVYLDPPYNQHSYFSNYHVWETLIRWDAPESYGIACKRLDCKTTKSDYNRRRESWPALSRLIGALTPPLMLVSFSDEGFHELGALESLLAERGHLRPVAFDFDRYVGARIGIHNPSGQRVGRVSHLRNTEHLFVVGPDAGAVAAAAAAIDPARARAA